MFDYMIGLLFGLIIGSLVVCELLVLIDEYVEWVKMVFYCVILGLEWWCSCYGLVGMFILCFD